MTDIRKDQIKTLLLVTVSTVVVAGAYTSAAPVQNNDGGAVESLDLRMLPYSTLGVPEQDVFVQGSERPGQVFRPRLTGDDGGAELFSTAIETPHDPFEVSRLGPHPKGESLGFTLDEWVGQEGRGDYRCEDGVGHLELRFEGLVPAGTYSLWHTFTGSTDGEHFTGTLWLPLGGGDGTRNVFAADRSGEALVKRRFEPCLEMSDLWTRALLTVNYHSNGRPHGRSPGNFGLDAHVALLTALPVRISQ